MRSEYRTKLTNCVDVYQKERASEWALDTCERAVKEIRDSNQSLLENALKNKNIAIK